MSTRLATPEVRPAAAGSAKVWTAVLLAGVALALLAQFVLDSFADSSTVGHWTQHGLLFWSGLVTGVALLRLYQLGGRTS